MDDIETVAGMIFNSRKVVVFTGAGISTESGIQDFRSPGGLWHQWNPDELTFDKFMSNRASREHYWGFSRAIWPTMSSAKPNIGHYAITDLYKIGKLESVITQNVDGLHQAAGVPDDKVVELHGTIRWVSCLSCGKRWPREEIEEMMDRTGEKAPECKCGGYLKQATIAFGQSLPADAIMQAEEKSSDCDVFIVAGSSLVVYPAAQMPLLAKDNGAKLVIITLSETPHDRYADVIINEKTGQTLNNIAKMVKSKM
ncbi:MAG: Sir2 family NAD-dependent protein deacetylase [Dehalococcoidales bacterium]|nr:Sir2 family NAD-dependent protein deacetylase [Dehalococcoidales bacterium]